MKRYLSSINVIIFICFCIALAFWLSMFPLYNDDHWYAEWFTQDTEKDYSVFELILRTWSDHYNNDNGRLANIVMVPLLFIPKWIVACISAAAFSWAIIKSLRITGLPICYGIALPFTLLLMVFLMPWQDSMGAQDYMLNYLVPSAIIAASAGLFLKSAPSDLKNILTAFILGILAGAWHEAFGASLLGAGIIMLIIFRKYRTLPNIILLSAIFIGLVYLVTAPGTLHRVSESQSLRTSYLRSAVAVALLNPAFIIMILTSIWYLVKFGWKSLIAKRERLMFILMALTGYGIHCLTTTTPRTGWWSAFCSIISICALIADGFPAVIKGNKKVWKIISVALAVPMMANLILTDYYSVVIRNEYMRVRSLIESNPEETIFYNFIPEKEVPLIVKNTLEYDILSKHYNLLSLERLYHFKLGSLTAVPLQIADVTDSTGTLIPGNAGIRIVGSYMVAPAHLEDTIKSKREAIVDFGFIKEKMKMTEIPYKSRKDGKSRMFVRISRTNLPELWISDIKSIDWIAGSESPL